MAVTRIKNNQITDSTITYQKIANGTLVGTNFNANLTLNSNVTILGNLTVSNNYIQLNSINTYINDPVVVFNNNYSGSLTGYDIGILVNRNLSTLSNYGSVNTFWGWVEADQAFEAITTTDTGTGVSTINNSGYANVKVGNITSISETISGVLTAGSIQNTPIGSTTASSAAFTTLSASGLVTFTNGTASTAYTNGALVVTGGVGVGGNVNVFGNITTATGNIITTSAGFFVGNATTGFGALYAGIPVGFTALPQLVSQFSENYNGYAQINSQNINAGNQSTTDYVATANNGTDVANYIDLGIAGSGYDGTNPNNSLGTSLYANDAYLYTQGNLTSQFGGNLVLGATTAARSVKILSGGVNAANIVATFNTPGTVSAGTTSGALVLTGGAGISGAVNIGGSVTGGAAIFSSLNNTPIGGSTPSTAAFTTETVGGLQAQAIGNVTPGSGAFTTLTASGITQITNSTQATSTTTGALVISGGVGVAKDMYVAGNIYAGNIIGSISSTITIQDSLVYFQAPSPLIPYNYDSGFYSDRVVDGIYSHMGLARKATGNAWVLFANVQSEPSATGVNWADAGLAYDSLITGNIVIANTTVSTSSTTGALIVGGGAGIAGAVYAGSIQNTPIGSTTASTGAFTTATTGGLQAQAIGNVTPGTAAFTTLSTSGVITSAGNVVITSGTDVTAATGVGALIVTGTGGASIASNVSIGNNLYVGGTSAFGQALASAGIIVSKAGAAYAQVALKNTTNTGSADYAAYADNGNDTGGWTDMGIAGSAFNDPTYTITKPQDGYLITRPISSTYGGNLVLGTSEAGSFNDITLSVGSFYANAEVARFHGNTNTSGTFVLKLPTNNTNTANTGAFQVWGGESISGNSYIGGAMVINGSQTAGYDFKVRGKNDATLIWARPSATYDAVIIGNSAVQANVVTGAKLQVFSTDSLLLPAGTSAQRPGSAGGTDTLGMFRYNTTLNAIEYYGGATPGWQLVSSQFTVIADQQASGDGVTTVFTLSEPQTTNSCIVSINGVIQIPTLAYSVSGTTLTFTEAPASGDVIDIRKLTTTQTVTGIASTNGYMQFLVDNNGAYVYTGSSSTAATTYWDTTGAEVNARANVTAAGTGDTLLDSFTNTVYSSGEYFVTATIPNTNIRETAKILVVQDGTTATRVVYGVVSTSGNSLVSYSANISSGATRIYGTPTNAGTIFRVKKDYQAI